LSGLHVGIGTQVLRALLFRGPSNSFSNLIRELILSPVGIPDPH
jgi:hypothetical protein